MTYRLLLLVLAAALVLVACDAATETAAGVVVDVRGSGALQVDAFTIRTGEGEELTFRVGPLDVSRGGFPASHLREHMATAQPVAVFYRLEDGERVAVKVVDT